MLYAGLALREYSDFSWRGNLTDTPEQQVLRLRIANCC